MTVSFFCAVASAPPANAQNGCSDTAYRHWDLASLNLSDMAQSIQLGNAVGLAGFDNVMFTAVPVMLQAG